MKQEKKPVEQVDGERQGFVCALHVDMSERGVCGGTTSLNIKLSEIIIIIVDYSRQSFAWIG